MTGPLPAAAGVIKVSVVNSDQGDTTLTSRFFIHYSGTAPTVAQLNAFCTSIVTAWTNNLAALTNNSAFLTLVSAQDLSSSTGAVGQAVVSVAATRTGQALPLNCNTVVQYSIARRYRGGKPKGFWNFGVQADLTSAKQWSNTFLTAVNSGINAFFTAVLAAGWTGAGTLTQVNVSYFAGFTVFNPGGGKRAKNIPTLRGTPIQDTITGYVAKAFVGSQRRRIRAPG